MPSACLPHWTTLAPEEIERQFNPRASVPNATDYFDRMAPHNRAAQAALACRRDLPYGDHPLRRVDIYTPKNPGNTPAPVHLFIHGGYWRALDKSDYAFIAQALCARGITTVLANYELCPGTTLDGVVDSALAAFAWTCQNIRQYGGDPARISLSGHSAGAHLAAAVLSHDWSGVPGIPRALASTTLISGVFDPEPAMHTSVNKDLHLTREIAARNNLQARVPTLAGPIALFVGALEPPYWVDMTMRYAHTLRQAGLAPSVQVVPGCHHFDITDQYLEAGSAIGRSISG